MRKFHITGWGLAALLMAAALAAPVGAAKHALLIGVGTYPHLADRKQLEGPAHDVAALADHLKNAAGFPADRVQTLVDAQATRGAVMAAVKGLLTRTRKGDEVFLYYSGHGTSAHNNPALDLDPFTGALMPYDFREGGAAEMVDRLIVGSRDLKPILKKLDRDRRVLAVFDACYSGYAVRTMRPPGTAKFVSLGLEDLVGDGAPPAFGAHTRKRPPYPYRNIIYISAASDRQTARDIDTSLIRLGERTFDGKPHGALTDALMRGIRGAGDTDGNGRVTYNELHGFVRAEVHRRFGHTPQMLYAQTRKAALDEPVFLARSAGGPKPPTPAPEKPEGPLRVKLEDVGPDLRSAISGIPGVTVTDGAYDLMVSYDAPGERAIGRPVYLYLPNGALLDKVAQNRAADRIRAQARVRRLIGLTCPNQAFNVFLNIVDGKAVLLDGEDVAFRIRSEAKTHIFLVNIDAGGGVNVIYPCKRSELAPFPADKEKTLDIGQVSGPPFGTETVKVFAFKDKPDGLEQFLCAGISPDSSRFDKLMRMIDSNVKKGAAQATISAQTADREGVAWVGD